MALYEGGGAVGCCASAYTFCSNLLPNILSILNIQFMQSLDVIIHKCNWNQHQVLLPDQPVRVGPAQLLHHQLHRGAHLGGVGVPPVHHVLGDRVGGEQQHHLTPDVLGEGLQLLLDVLSESLDEKRMCWPPVND